MDACASDYAAKLRDPRWQRRRLAVFARDDWTCRFCGETRHTLHVHHLAYESGREPWEYPLESLLTVCEPCHELERRRDRLERQLVRAIRLAGLNALAVDRLAELFAGAELALAYPDARRAFCSSIGGILERLAERTRSAASRNQLLLWPTGRDDAA